MSTVALPRLQAALQEMSSVLSTAPERIEVYGSASLVALLLMEGAELGLSIETLEVSSWRVGVLSSSEVLLTVMDEWDLPDDLVTGEILGEGCDLFRVRFPPPGLTRNEEEVYTCLRDGGLPPAEAREAAGLVVR